MDQAIFLQIIMIDGHAGNVDMLYLKEKDNQKLELQEDLLENAQRRKID